MLELHNLPKSSSSNKKKKRVGRGNASSGNYSGRGMKGQRSRSGGKGGLKLRGLKQSMMSMPKNRGFKSLRERPQAVNIGDLEKVFETGSTVTAQDLYKKGLISSPKKKVKVLGTGKLKKKLTIQAQSASKTALEAISKSGGTFEAVELPKRQKTTGKQTADKKTADKKTDK